MKILRKIANWFYRIKKEDSGRIRMRILFFVIKYWPNKRVRELLHSEALLAQQEKEQQTTNQALAEARQRINELAPSWERERQIFEALEIYKFVPPYEPQGRKKSDVPANCIWQLWWQGEEQMPDIVRFCTDSVRKCNPDRRVILLTQANLSDYIDLPEHILKKHSEGTISTTLLSDIIRLYLLAEYGGTWIDATVYMSGPMPHEIEQAPFFLFKNLSWMQLGTTLLSPDNLRLILDGRSNPYHCFSSWFMHARCGNRYLCKILAMMLSYWDEHNAAIDYFIFHYLGTWALFGDAQSRLIFKKSPWKSQLPPHFLQGRMLINCTDSLLQEFTHITPIHKLTYKYDQNATIQPATEPHAIYRSWHDGAPLHENTDFFKFNHLTDGEYQRRWQLNEKLEKQLKERVRKGEKIRVTFLVGMSSMFPARPLMEQMLKDERYEVHLVIIPELRFGEERTRQLLKSTPEELAQYHDIMQIAPINPYEDKIRLADFTDIVVPPTPYDISTQWYDYGSLLKQGLLVAMVNYGFYRSSNYDRSLISLNPYQTYWKILVETEYNMAEYANYAKRAHGRNTILTGYCKMDAYKPYEARPANEKKTVLIAPHHSVEGGFNDILALSNFMRYADLFLLLPEQYPDINFIFRPHPALFPVLERETHWGKEKADAYTEQMKAHPNVRWSDSGNYFEDFAESDAIIQDCGSFLVDYFYTGKPQCYMLHSEKDIDEKFAPLGQKCLSNCYLAYDEAAIRDFMEEVVIKGNDPKKEVRQKFSREEIMLNYPNASAKATDLLYNALSC